MGKASKRERQKLNRAAKEEERKRKESRKKTLNVLKTVGLILIVPIVIIVATIINRATDPDIYTAKITFAVQGVDQNDLPNNGVLEIALDHANSPNSVKHFNGFASNGLYDDTTIHRVSDNFVIQGGDPEGTGAGSIGSTIIAETPKNGYKPGDVAWAKNQGTPAGSAGSQFFIITGDEDSDGLAALNTKVPQADGSEQYDYGFIGRTTNGLEVAKYIEGLVELEETEEGPAGDGPPSKEVTIVSIEVFKNGDLIQVGDLIPATTLPGEAPQPANEDEETPESEPQDQ